MRKDGEERLGLRIARRGCRTEVNRLDCDVVRKMELGRREKNLTGTAVRRR